MVKQLTKTKRPKRTVAKKNRGKREWPDEEELMFRAAIKYLILNHAMFLVPTARREILIRGGPAWIFTVTLRLIDGHEGYVGDLLYDGEAFTMLTDTSVINERLRKIYNDPERMRKWNEYRASTLRAGKR